MINLQKKLALRLSINKLIEVYLCTLDKQQNTTSLRTIFNLKNITTMRSGGKPNKFGVRDLDVRVSCQEAELKIKLLVFMISKEDRLLNISLNRKTSYGNKLQEISALHVSSYDLRCSDLLNNSTVHKF
jgi:hypothetical protein